MNSELIKKALEKVGNPNVLVNLISKRVRQLTSAGGSVGRPLVQNAESLGTADIALTELIGDMLVVEAEEGETEAASAPRRRKT